MRRFIPVLAFATMAISLVIFNGCSSDDEDPVTPPTCSIQMQTPEAGRNYFTGDNVDIRWATNGTPSTVDIELVRGDQDTTITTGWANSGFYPWSINAYGYGTHDDYQIRVTGTGQPDCSDTTGQFTITSLSGCSITFPYSAKDTIPTQMAGDDFTIEYDAVNSSGDLQLEIWTTTFAPAWTRDKLLAVIDPSIDDSGSYVWTVNSFNHSDDGVYRWYLRDNHLNTCTAESYQFRIIDNAVCSMIMGGIDRGRTYNPGETIDIAVIGTNLTGNVDLQLDGATGAVPNGSIVKNWDPTTGTFAWQVNDYGWTGSNAYRVRATSSDDPYCTEVSDMFSITQ